MLRRRPRRSPVVLQFNRCGPSTSPYGRFSRRVRERRDLDSLVASTPPLVAVALTLVRGDRDSLRLPRSIPVMVAGSRRGERDEVSLDSGTTDELTFPSIRNVNTPLTIL